VQYRVDGPGAESIAVHIRAVKDVLNILNATNVVISEFLQRALFWQDLYSCLFVGTSRVLSHQEHDVDAQDLYEYQFPNSSVPLGFLTLIPELSEMGLILKDLNALCATIDTHSRLGVLQIHGLPIDHHQWALASRTVDVLDKLRRSGAEDLIYEMCIFATLLCTYKLSTGIWEGCFIPDYYSTQILGLALQAKSDPRWEDWSELLLWLLFVSGALSKKLPIRKKAMNLIKFEFNDRSNGMYEDWINVETCMRKFIWCSKSMEETIRRFWEDVRSSADTLQ
jgi:hypothetical protein